MKKVLIIIFIFILILGSCIRKDNVKKEAKNSTTLSQTQEKISFPKISKTVNKDGVDYLQSQADIGKYGGELIISTIGEGPKTFNPFNTKDATSDTMASIMYDGLVTSRPDTGEIVPKLAKSFKISPDGKVYTIYLRNGIKWSDNKPITADDVVFTWNKIILAGLGNTSTRDSVMIDGHLPVVKKIDNYTIQFITKKPFAPFLRNLTVSIAPKHIFEKAVNNGEEYFNSFLSTTTKPEDFVVSGAYKLKEYIPAQRVVYEKNPNYYMVNLKNEKLPYLSKIVFLIVGDLNNEILKFEAGEIDEISLRGSTVGKYKEKENNSDYIIHNLGADTGTMFIAINLNTGRSKTGKPFVDSKKQLWFNDKNFRYAIDYAIDREAIVNNIANGLGQPLFTAESLNSIYLNKKLANGHKQNINLAKEYLNKSGFKIKNKVLYDRYGNKVEFDLYTNAGNTEREAIGVMIKQDLENLGMKVNFKPIEFNSLVNKLVNDPQWDLVIMGLTGSPLEPHNGKNVWYSNGSLHLFNQRVTNTPLLSWEKELDKIIDEASLKISYADRKKYYDKYQEIIYYEKPIIYLYSPIRVVAIRKKFGNIYPSELSGVTYNLEEIYIK